MVFERRNVVFNILIDEKTQKNILIMDLMGKRQAPTNYGANRRRDHF